MGSIDLQDNQHYGRVCFSEPDFSLKAEARAFFALPKKKRIVEEKILLHDFSDDSSLSSDLPIVRGPEGLDVQGFTFVRHKSALKYSDDPQTSWFAGTNIEDVYLAEVERLVCEVTGAKSAIVNNCAIRRRQVVLRNGDTKGNSVKLRGDPFDQAIAKIPRDRAFIGGREEASTTEPARAIHIDYTREGLQRTLRECRKDIKAMAAKTIDLEDKGQKPRYAAYSVWRPLKQVKRDPLAVCDYRSMDKDLFAQSPYRALSGVNDNGEYMMESHMVGVPTQEQLQRMKFYFMPGQKEDQVLILKFDDTAADWDGDIAAGVAHGSPILEGTEEEETRMSIECRVIAFWE